MTDCLMSHAGSHGRPQRSAVPPAHAVLGLSSPRATSDANAAGPSAKRSRKDRAPNWTAAEVLALVAAKTRLQDDENNCIDKRNLMHPELGKWQKISEYFHEAHASDKRRDGAACKSKWNQVVPEYERIADYFSRTGTNELSYWTMSDAVKRAEGLPRSFPEDIFLSIRDGYGQGPAMQPLHSRDTMSTQDTDYGTAMEEREEAEVEDEHFPDDDDVMADDTANTEDNSVSIDPDRRRPRTPRERTISPIHLSSRSASEDRIRKSSVPVGVTPVMISSSENTLGPATRPAGSTGVRRKNLAGHSLIAEATRETGGVLADQMKDIAVARRELSMKQFSEQLEYQRERDRRLYENARLSNENAKLSIQKQGEVVDCLARLSTVMTSGFEQWCSTTEAHVGKRKTAVDIQTVVPPMQSQNPEK